MTTIVIVRCSPIPTNLDCSADPRRVAMRRLIVVGFVADDSRGSGVVAHRPLGAEQSPPGPTNAPYMMSSFADIMSATQWRHLKLAYSGIVSNWPLANYAWSKCDKAFPRLRSSIPYSRVFRSHNSSRTRASLPLLILAKRSRSKIARISPKPSHRLTDACNHCHRQVGMGFVVIRVPTSSPFSNQLFPPAQ